MKLLLASFTAAMGSAPEKHRVLSGLLPPLERGKHGMDIDYSLLLCADKLVFDRRSYEHLADYSHEGIRKLRESMRLLHDAGFLELEDFRASLHQNRQALKDQLRLLTADLSGWLPQLKLQLRRYPAVLQGLRDSFGSALSAWDEHTFGISSYQFSKRRKINARESQRLRDLVLATEEANQEEVRNIVTPVVRVVQANLHMATELRCVPYCWGTLTGYFDQTLAFLARKFEVARTSIRKCHRFFAQVFPQFAPRDATGWVKLLEDKRVRHLRQRIARAIAGEEVLDEEFGRRSLEALARTENRLARFKKYSAWAAFPVEVAGALIGHYKAGIPGAVAGHSIPRMVHAGIETAVHHALMKQHAWLYFTAGFGHFAAA
jgi:hypothetical protein